MKALLLPCVAAASAAQEDVTSLLQAAKMFERSNSAGEMNALDASVSGKKKKGEVHNICDKAEAEKLIKCVNFAGFSLSEYLKGEGKGFDADMDIFEDLTDDQDNPLAHDHAKVKKSCAKLEDDMKCMQGNSCWKEVIGSYDIDFLSTACKDDTAKKLSVLGDLTLGGLCELSGNDFCKKMTADKDVERYLNHCSKDDDGKIVKDAVISCDAKIEEFVKSTLDEGCPEGQDSVTTEYQCEKAANLNGWRFHKIKKKQWKRRPKGCYHYLYHDKPTAYWNPRTEDKKSRRYKGKNRPSICLKN